MYVITGKGTIAGVDLTRYVYSKCQQRGVLFDDDFPEYTLDFKTQLPSISKSIREKNTTEIILQIQKSLKDNEKSHKYYMLLCLTAHKLIERLNTSLININLWPSALDKINALDEKIAYLGTFESYPSLSQLKEKLIMLPNQIEMTSDLILSIKRGYENYGDTFYAGPEKILKKIFDFYTGQNIAKYFIACTDLHFCKKHLVNWGIPENNIIDIIEIAGDKIIEIKGKDVTNQLLKNISEIKDRMEKKYSA
jgi:hypothetical protein